MRKYLFNKITKNYDHKNVTVLQSLLENLMYIASDCGTLENLRTKLDFYFVHTHKNKKWFLINRAAAVEKDVYNDVTSVYMQSIIS